MSPLRERSYRPNKFEVVKSIGLIALAMVFPLVTFIILGGRINSATTKNIKANCESVNEVREQFLKFIDNTLDRSAQTAQAVLGSPNATPDQKATARSNVAAVKDLKKRAHEALPPHDCDSQGGETLRSRGQPAWGAGWDRSAV